MTTQASTLPITAVIEGETPWKDEMMAGLLYLEVAKATNVPFDLRAFFNMLHDRSVLYIDRYAPMLGASWKRETQDKLMAVTRNAEALLAQLEVLAAEHVTCAQTSPQ